MHIDYLSQLREPEDIYLFLAFQSEGSNNPGMKRLFIQVFERHPTLSFTLGRVWLWILKI
jgi:hypothetical protein